MQIKRFKAQDMSTALKMIKEEFGPEAVILSVRDLEKGKGFFGLMDNGGLEVTAATDTPLFDANLRAENPPPQPLQQEAPAVSVTLSGPRRKKAAAVACKPSSPPKPAPSIPSAVPAPAVLPVIRAPEVSGFLQELLGHGVTERIALEILSKISHMPNGGGHSPSDRMIRGMARIFREKGITFLSLAPESGKRKLVSFIGAAGVGKTTTIAKLAAFHSVRGKNVGIIALDDDRICALQKLEVLARIINVPMEIAVGNDDMQRALRRLRSKDIVYIDTPGISLKAHAGGSAGENVEPVESAKLVENVNIDPTVSWIREKLGMISGIQHQLLVSAAAKEKDIAEFVRRCADLPVHGLTVTKLDESTTYGNLLNHLYQMPMPLSYFADGQRIPEDIRPASSRLLAGLFVDTHEDTAVPKIVPQQPGRNHTPMTSPPDLEKENPYEGIRYYGGFS